ncbi:phosphate/phosphite/phosphonate ABC transporter substrate-binding protein [Candidatus Parcubacteria bacterium]|nr:phosphate/phosphite/phosphonate ABC transporter substrate-binding protein [Candidatus Parcubacteria bacterium]
MFKNKRFNLFIFSVSLFVIAICSIIAVYRITGDGEPAKISDLTDPAAVADLSGEKSYYLGILPLRNPSTMLKRFAGLEEYLREKTGLNIKLRIYPTSGAVGGYTAVVRDITEGKIDFAFLAPVTSVQAHVVNSAVQVFVCAQKAGSPVYYGHIVVRSDSPYKRIEDLKGKAVCGTSMSSTSGNLMPTAMLLEKGIDKNTYFKPFKFLGSHDKATEAVLAGTMEAAFINETTFDKYKERGLRSVWKHSAVPEFNFNVNTEKITSEELMEIKNALLAMHETNLEDIKAVDPKYDKWVEIGSGDYACIKEALSKVHGPVFYDLDKWGK